MKAIFKKSNRRIICSLLALMLLVSGVTATKASAAGVETLPAGSYEIGGFTFTNNNLTPVKTVGATGHIKFGVAWRISNNDAGLGDIKLTVQVRNASTQRVLTSMVVKREPSDDGWYIYDETSPIYVTAGTKLQIWFDASSVGASNGNYRTALIKSFTSILY